MTQRRPSDVACGVCASLRWRGYIRATQCAPAMAMGVLGAHKLQKACSGGTSYVSYLGWAAWTLRGRATAPLPNNSLTRSQAREHSPKRAHVLFYKLISDYYCACCTTRLYPYQELVLRVGLGRYRVGYWACAHGLQYISHAAWDRSAAGSGATLPSMPVPAFRPPLPAPPCLRRPLALCVVIGRGQCMISAL